MNSKIQESFNKLHKDVVNMIAEWCYDNEVDCDKISLNANGFNSSYKVGKWHPETDSLFVISKNNEQVLCSM